MTLTILKKTLSSRAVREVINRSGGRAFDNFGQIEKPDEGGFIQKILSAAAKVTGFLVKKIWQILSASLQFSWTVLWGAIVSTSQFIYRFNWNITEEQIKQEIEGQLTQLAGTLGGTLGNSLGWLAGGVLPGTLIFAFNEPLGLYILEQVGEEALEELAANIAQLVRLTFSLATRSAAYFLFLKMRKALYGDKPREKKPWSFASKVEEKVEEIENNALQQFVEEFLEEFAESSIEAGYVIANNLDAWNAQQKMSQQLLLGTDRAVEIDFRRDDGEE